MDKIALIEVLDRDGQLRQSYPVTAWPVSLGRSLDCDIVLDDPHVAPRHLSLEGRPEGLLLAVGDSVNGVKSGRSWLRAGSSALRPPGEELLLGGTRLRVRLRGEPLAPEVAVPRPGSWRPGLPASALGASALWLAWMSWEEYLATDPGEFLLRFALMVIVSCAALSLWSLLWALGSKLFRHRFDYWTHLRIAASGLLASGVLGALLAVLAFASSWVLLSRIRPAAETAVLAGAVYAHLCAVLPSRRRRLAVATTLLTAGGLATAAAFQWQRSGRLTDELYLTTLPPPALRLALPVAPQTFLEEAAALKDRLDRKARDEDTEAAADESVEEGDSSGVQD
ncbi:FHA domain-containing protein [Aquabacterium sp. A7-Y]|uniref:FHA domain-containing protein n=1 Tax=Aquabacterium sp. A7-Y TaxID=1349605 RepID=UPI00223D5D6F|nr:FHA domain-containing protein [Aquabacterium sp. A7-Y]MCW7537110.1 FHA domain-containing protein [Aquabacterium sp. A7-Y]